MRACERASGFFVIAATAAGANEGQDEEVVVVVVVEVIVEEVQGSAGQGWEGGWAVDRAHACVGGVFFPARSLLTQGGGGGGGGEDWEDLIRRVS